jgi:hypothetical protein
MLAPATRVNAIQDERLINVYDARRDSHSPVEDPIFPRIVFSPATDLIYDRASAQHHGRRKLVVDQD